MFRDEISVQAGRFRGIMVLVTVFLFILSLQGCGQMLREKNDMITAFKAKEYVSSDGSRLLYRLLSPAVEDAGMNYPLVVFLHGSGERGDDNRAQLVHGTWVFEEKRNREAFPAWVIAAQCPAGERWADIDWSSSTPQMADDITETSAQLMELLETFMGEHAVDRDRIYITGLSMGGYGTWDLLVRFPDFFAAGAPVCGGGDVRYAGKISHIPQWAFHGADDPVVPLKASQAMVESLRELGSDVRFTVYPGVGHGSWVPAYEEKELLPWMFGQRKAGDGR